MESDYPSNDYKSRNYSGNWKKQFINEYIDTLFSFDIDCTEQRLAEAKNEHLPSSLYKFFPPTLYSLINLQNQQLYLSSSRCFNDPFDSYACIEENTFIKYYLLDHLKRKNLISKENTPDTISDKEKWELFHSLSTDKRFIANKNYPYQKSFQTTLYDICESKSEELISEIRSIQIQAYFECSNKTEYLRNIPFRITCFSNFKDEYELGCNTTMWSHYAANHQGFCVKFLTDFGKLKYKSAIKCGLFPITYTSVVPKISPRELMKLKHGSGELVLTKSIIKTALKTLITKSKSWSYEKEWRLIINAHNSIMLPNNTISFLNVDSIYLGCKMDKSLKNQLVRFAESNGIKVFQSKQSNEKFELYFATQSRKEMKEEEFYEQLKICNKIEDESVRLKRVMALNNEYEELSS